MDTASHRTRGYGLVLLAAGLWATLGIIFKQLLNTYALPQILISYLRAALGGGAILAGLALWRREELHITWRDMPFLVGFGLLGVAAFFAVYVMAVDLAGVTVAVILLYTAPAWVAVLSACFLGERIDALKIACVALSIAGCALIARVYHIPALSLNSAGLLAGIGSGLTYALFSVFIKVGVRQHSTWTVLGYGYAIGALFLLPFQSMHSLSSLAQPGAWLWLALLIVGPTLGAGASFAAGVRHVPVSNASVIATLEPLIAALLAYTFLGERLEVPQLVGGGLVLAAVILLARRAGD
ncbi:MAG: EamA family transporter [Thermoflexales bacterium]|nr:EamA family transporter [Thermoflexales bacterium]